MVNASIDNLQLYKYEMLLMVRANDANNIRCTVLSDGPIYNTAEPVSYMSSNIQYLPRTRRGLLRRSTRRRTGKQVGSAIRVLVCAYAKHLVVYKASELFYHDVRLYGSLALL